MFASHFSNNSGHSRSRLLVPDQLGVLLLKQNHEIQQSTQSEKRSSLYWEYPWFDAKHSRNNDTKLQRNIWKFQMLLQYSQACFRLFQFTDPHQHWYMITVCTLIKKKIKFSSWKGFLIYEEMRKYFPIYEDAVSYIWLQLLHSEFPYIWGKFDYLFCQCRKEKGEEETGDHTKERQQGSNALSKWSANKKMAKLQ